MTRILAVFSLILTLVACGAQEISEANKKDLGDFSLGHNIVVAPDLVKGPLSREGSKEDWIREVKAAVATRLGRYDGERLVHLGVNVSGYVLAQTGIPLVMSPKSALVITVTAWDDRVGKKFHEEPYQIVVSESVSGKTVLGSGLTSTAEEQMKNLSFNVAGAIEAWLARNAHCMTDNPGTPAGEQCWVNQTPDNSTGSSDS